MDYAQAFFLMALARGVDLDIAAPLYNSDFNAVLEERFRKGELEVAAEELAKVGLEEGIVLPKWYTDTVAQIKSRLGWDRFPQDKEEA